MSPSLSSMERTLRDLRWCIESPSLINHPIPRDLQPVTIDWEEIQSRLELSFSLPKNHRVGRYFESLIEFWVRSVSQGNILAKNLQITENGRTRGEIDLVFQTRENEVVHVETAVKFYLYHPACTVLNSHYIGPNTGDTLERKLDRLLNNQLSLIAPDLPPVHQHHAYVKGRIFYHPSHPRPQQLPPHLSPSHAVGTWLPLSQWKEYCRSAGLSHFRVLKKPHWLAAETTSDPPQHDLLIADAMHHKLDQHFSKSAHSLLIAAFASKEIATEEQERLFVVHDDWPNPVPSIAAS